MSLGGGVSTALDTAVTNAITAGVVFAIAAGNDNANACKYDYFSCMFFYDNINIVFKATPLPVLVKLSLLEHPPTLMPALPSLTMAPAWISLPLVPQSHPIGLVPATPPST